MSRSQPQNLFGTTNELAKERNRAAAERTINAWIGTCLSLMGSGIAIDQISHSLHQQFPDVDPVVTQTAANITSVVFVGAGLGLLVVALVQHRLVVKSIEQADYIWLSVNALNRVAIAAISIIGLMGLLSIFILLQG